MFLSSLGSIQPGQQFISLQQLFYSQYQPLPRAGTHWVKRSNYSKAYLAQGYKCHDRDSNTHSGDLGLELEFVALHHSAMTLYIKWNILHA